MRLKSDGDGPGLEFAGALDDAREQEAMTKVDTVKVADADYGWAFVSGKLG
jgi:hypothetical protein